MLSSLKINHKVELGSFPFIYVKDLQTMDLSIKEIEKEQIIAFDVHNHSFRSF